MKHYISHMGGLWCLNDHNYKRLCRTLIKKFKEGKEFEISLDDFGAMIGIVENLGGMQDEVELAGGDDPFHK